MERVCQRRMSTAETAEVWRRWKQGESLADIGRALGRIRRTIHDVVAAHGGVPPRVRTRSHCAASWPRSSRTIGRRSKLLGGLRGPFRGILGSTCRTRRST